MIDYDEAFPVGRDAHSRRNSAGVRERGAEVVAPYAKCARICRGLTMKSMRPAKVVEDAVPYAGCGADSPGSARAGPLPCWTDWTDWTDFSITGIKIDFLKEKVRKLRPVRHSVKRFSKLVGFFQRFG